MLISEMMKDPNHVLWDDVNTPEKENLTDILERSLKHYPLIVELFDMIPDKWTWGKLHTITYPTNVLGEAVINFNKLSKCWTGRSWWVIFCNKLYRLGFLVIKK